MKTQEIDKYNQEFKLMIDWFTRGEPQSETKSASGEKISYQEWIKSEIKECLHKIKIFDDEINAYDEQIEISKTLTLEEDKQAMIGSIKKIQAEKQKIDLKKSELEIVLKRLICRDKEWLEIVERPVEKLTGPLAFFSKIKNGPIKKKASDWLKEEADNFIKWSDFLNEAAPEFKDKKDEQIEIHPFGNLPYVEIAAAFADELVQELEPIFDDQTKVTSKPYKEKTFDGLPTVVDITQGKIGNCATLSVIGIILSRLNGSETIMAMMRDLSEPCGNSTIGKKMGLKDDQVIMVRLFKNNNFFIPQYVLVKKSLLQTDKRSQGAFYIHAIEKAIIGLACNRDLSQVKGHNAKETFGMIAGREGPKEISINQKSFTQDLKNLHEIINKIKAGTEPNAVQTDLLKNIFSDDEIKQFKYYCKQLKEIHGFDEKNSLKPLIDAFNNIPQKDEKNRTFISVLQHSFSSDLNYQTTVGCKKISSFLKSNLNEGTLIIMGSKSGLKESKEKGPSGESISAYGIGSPHAYMFSKIVTKMISGDPKEFVVLGNPWGGDRAILELPLNEVCIYFEDFTAAKPFKSTTALSEEAMALLGRMESTRCQQVLMNVTAPPNQQSFSSTH